MVFTLNRTDSAEDYEMYAMQNEIRYDSEVPEKLLQEERTMIFYESPHRLEDTLQTLADIFPDRPMAAARELTKKFETVMPMTLSEAVAFYKENEPKGEYVLVVEGKSLKARKEEKQKEWQQLSIEEHMALYEGREMDRKEAMKQVAKDRGISKREVYDYLIKNC